MEDWDNTYMRKYDANRTIKVYIRDFTAWGDNMRAYSYINGGNREALSDWDTTKATTLAKETVDGEELKYVELPGNYVNYSLILSNNGSDTEREEKIVFAGDNNSTITVGTEKYCIYVRVPDTWTSCHIWSWLPDESHLFGETE